MRSEELERAKKEVIILTLILPPRLIPLLNAPKVKRDESLRSSARLKPPLRLFLTRNWLFLTPYLLLCLVLYF